MKKKVLIIGAGPAGLSAAYRLLKKGKNSFLVDIFEADNQVGGLSKTVEFNGYYYDLGGHRFFSNIAPVLKLWGEVMTKGFINRKRLSRIYHNCKFFHYPLQIKNALFNLGLVESFLIGLSFIKSKLFPKKPETTFDRWVSNRFGERLYKIFFKVYTKKVWGVPCNQIQAEWAAQRIKNLSLVTAVLNALPLVGKRNKIKTLLDKFKYPKLGPGMMYEAMAKIITKDKDFALHLNTEVSKLAYNDNKWHVTTKYKNKSITKAYDEIVSTMPITSLVMNMEYDMPDKIRKIVKGLTYRDLLIVCLAFDKKTKLKDTWIYMQDNAIKAGRLRVLDNWSPYMLKDPNTSSYGVEYFCNENDKIWSMSDKELVELAVSEIKKINLIGQDYNLIQGNVVRVKKAYPVYNEFYAKNMIHLINFIKNAPNLQVAGRYGMFKYNNMDHSIYTGLLAAENIVSGFHRFDVWKVNQDEEYHEEERIKHSEETSMIKVFDKDVIH